MRCSSYLLLLLLSGNVGAAEFVVAGGVEGDSANGLAATLLGNLAVGDNTWLSGGVGHSSVDLPFRQDLETSAADIGIDHYFEPIGARAFVAYWGDNRVLDSVDAGISLYASGDRGLLGLDYEYRDFELDIPRTEFFPARTVNFHANGIGLTARADFSDRIDLRVTGMRYDYSVNLRLDPNRDIINLITATRLSLINTLVDYNASVTFGLDFDLRRLEIDLSQWQGAVAGSKTNSYTLRFLTPIGQRSDIEFALGYDDSENYGQVTVFSIYLYFYGGT